ncbi:MAG TPA: DUF3343 domain-containing protein [Firmicutes bacterium]|nr:DUF3343 domain-containing protein [Bacillota bacterium]
MQAVLLFPSVHQVLRAEKVLGKAGVAGSLIPVPRQLSSDCGMAWSLAPELVETALATLKAAGLWPETGWAETEDGWSPLDLDGAIAPKP